MLRCHRGILGWSVYTSGAPSGVPSIGGVSPRPMPRLRGDYEERGEGDTRRPRQASASVILGGILQISL